MFSINLIYQSAAKAEMPMAKFISIHSLTHSQFHEFLSETEYTL